MLGFLFHKCKSSCCLGFILVISNIAVMIIIIVMAAHYAVGVIETDLCSELSRANGLVALLRQEAGLGFEGLNAVVSSSIPNVLNDMCKEFAQLCNYPGQEKCVNTDGSCTQASIDAVFNDTYVYDNISGTYIPILECPDECSTDDLRDSAQRIIDVKTAFDLLNSIIEQIYSLLSGIVSGSTITGFVNDFCNFIGNALTLMYVGCACLAASVIASVALLIWLSWNDEK